MEFLEFLLLFHLRALRNKIKTGVREFTSAPAPAPTSVARAAIRW